MIMKGLESPKYLVSMVSRCFFADFLCWVRETALWPVSDQYARVEWEGEQLPGQTTSLASERFEPEWQLEPKSTEERPADLDLFPDVSDFEATTLSLHELRALALANPYALWQMLCMDEKLLWTVWKHSQEMF